MPPLAFHPLLRWSVLALVFSNSVAAFSDPSTNPAAKESEVSSMRNAIEEREKNKDIEGLVQLAEKIEAKWGKDKDVTIYGQLMLTNLHSLNRIQSRNIDYTATQGAIEKCVWLTLAKAKDLPLDMLVDLDLYLADLVEQPREWTDETWMQWRTREMYYWFLTWQRLAEAVDPAFDEKTNNGLLPPPSPPPEVERGEPGMPAEDIKDPKLRAIYEDQIRKCREAGERFITQTMLHRLQAKFQQEFELQVVFVYRKPPSADKELRENLKKYIKDEALRKRLLDAINAPQPAAPEAKP